MRETPAHVAFDCDNAAHHAVIGTVDFPMDDLLERLDGSPPPELKQPDLMMLAASELREVFHWVWQPEKHRRPKLQASFRRFIALSATMRPELLGNLTYRQLGELLGCTRAALCKQALLFTRQFGNLQFRRQHNGRDNMRAARIRSYQKQKHDEIKTTHPTA
jgi:hypothetical protein